MKSPGVLGLMMCSINQLGLKDFLAFLRDELEATL